jgi:hypothetical protein
VFVGINHGTLTRSGFRFRFLGSCSCSNTNGVFVRYQIVGFQVPAKVATVGDDRPSGNRDGLEIPENYGSVDNWRRTFPYFDEVADFRDVDELTSHGLSPGEPVGGRGACPHGV